jgi:alpha-beta hydrolase superfamily lysophospholipase
MTRAPIRENSAPHLHVDLPGRGASAIVLVLHGGRARGTDAVHPWSLAVLRMAPFARALRRAGAADGLVVARIRYRQRGWNGSAQAPVHDARWALEQLTATFPGVPVGLVGHSMGGRTAIHVADNAAVRSVVALAPWLETYDPIEPLRDRRVLIAHGDLDRVTDPTRSADFATRLQGIAESATYVSMLGEKHSMLGRAGVWHDMAAGFTIGALFGKTWMGTKDAAVTNVVTKALAGQQVLAL